MADVVVLGQIGCDVVVHEGQRRELLGGKGANQAVALTQLAVPVALVGVVGDDGAGREVRQQAAADGIDVGAVVLRRSSRTAVLTDLVGADGDRRLVEDVPAETLLTVEDVHAAAGLLAAARGVSVQLQQPGDAVRAALDLAPAHALVVVDGAPADERTRTALLARAHVVRADAREAALLVGRELDGVDDARAAAAELLSAGPRLVSLATGPAGDLVAWRAGPPLGSAGEGGAGPRWTDGEVLVPLLGDDPVDPTGAGDASVAALTTALLRGEGPEDAAWAAGAAAALTVGHAGGRPRLTPDRVSEQARRGRAG
ncbi:PfkB family carbohydrate kinase [Blastococcus goldschmidtiae]|uniref:PfkB family carbohydrate kinase n=1 Tax=Blastococcus goldschmidtiae TaxID=3075546 RepID=A0ABU2K475_9ACTN|nr:PfkB family carbohydrate kinase [Blastococcus sp. DSM 46792]MDT0274975.1 PfkB family carbohydrate kinase [Blastococcus sp. DSM 46792]